MTAEDVRAALTLRWPDEEYLSVDEAPQQCDRGGRKIDRLVLALWKSRGLERDAVEIKVTVSDWTRELREAAKADWWWRHTNRFWIAVPEKMAVRVESELPPTWGLLSCAAPDAKPVVVRQAPKHDAEPFPWPALVGIMRAASDCGFNALQRARAAGYAQGKEAGIEEGARQSGEGYALAQLKELQERVQAFEEASGLPVSDRWNGGAKLGHIVSLLRKEVRDPGFTFGAASRLTDVLENQAESIIKHARRARDAAGLLGNLVAENANGADR